MNYRHDFHAGNFADVLKHVVLTRILLYLARKPAPFRVIDTHAGSGRYDLAGTVAERTGEWRGGVGRLDPATFSPAARALIEPYWQLVAAAGAGEAPYPGSPALALALTRPFDRMIFCETHPEAFAALRQTIGRDKRAKALALDGYTGLNAAIPPPERRGLVVIDPPFEAADEFDRLTAAVLAAWRKWREGMQLIWCPVKTRVGVERLSAALVDAGPSDLLRLELAIAPRTALAEEMACLLPELARQLGGMAATGRVERLRSSAAR